MRLPRSSGGRNCPLVGAVVTRLSVTPAAVTDWPFEGLHWQEIRAVTKEGVPVQLYVSGRAVALFATKEMGVPVPVTVRFTGAVPPTVTGKVAAVVVSAKLWLVAVTVKLTGAVIAVLPLVPVTVIACAPEGRAMLAAVATVRATFIVCAGLPSRVTLPGLKLHNVPAGRPAVQLPGLEAVEFVKFTVPVKPLVGVMVRVDAGRLPSGDVAGLSALADMVNGTVTVTVVGAEVEALTDASPV